MKPLNIFFILLVLTGCSATTQDVVSPNEKIKVILETRPASDDASVVQAYFSVHYNTGTKTVEMVSASPLGITRADQQFVDSLTFLGASGATAIHDQYEMIHGKRSLRENFGTERIFHFENQDGHPVDIEFRAYNDGVAFRYVFPNQSDSPVNITGEATTYVLPEGTRRWMQPFHEVYEDFYPMTTTGSGVNGNQEWGFPALYEVDGQQLWGLISEANVTENNNGAKLSNRENPNEYRVTYPPERDNFQQTGAVSTLPWNSQWRTLIIGELSDIVESTLITDVSEPNTLSDTDWIQPGPVSWIYWAHNRGSKDYQIVVDYVDMAVEMGWPYMLIDWEWDVMSNGGDIEDAVSYSNSQGIKPLMWYNSGTSWLDPTPVDRLLTAESREEEFTWHNDIGVVGIKVDFFAGDQQDMMAYYIDILKDAADHELMVNFHGATIPRGWARTYPNLMTVEAVYGAEWYNNRPVLTDRAAAHNTVLPFTRNVIGSMDYTPVTFSDSQHPHITSYGHELALSVVFESAWQHFADRPSAYYSLPDEPREFLKQVPVSWDDTKLVDGYPGERVIIARRKGAQWYVGGLNGTDEAQPLELSFDFLEEGNFNLTLIKDGADDRSFSTETVSVTREDTITVETLPRGGFSGVLEAVSD